MQGIPILQISRLLMHQNQVKNVRMIKKDTRNMLKIDLKIKWGPKNAIICRAFHSK